MTDASTPAPAAGERIQRFRFRVVAPDGRELVSDVVAVSFPLPPAAAPASQTQAQAGAEAAKGVPEPGKDLEFPVSAIYAAVRCQKQGALHSEIERHGTKYSFAALSLEYEVLVPTDAASGHRSGKKQHRPLSMTKAWGAASPQLFQALVTNEVLDSVEIDCYGNSKDGKEELVHKLKLTNASVASFRQQAGGAYADKAGRGTGGDLETVAFAFEKIEHLSPKGDVVASDALGGS